LSIVPVERGTIPEGEIMNHHTLQACIDLAEAIEQDRSNFQVVRELLVELHHLAKKEEASA
jgi:hypothetical protein